MDVLHKIESKFTVGHQSFCYIVQVWIAYFVHCGRFTKSPYSNDVSLVAPSLLLTLAFFWAQRNSGACARELIHPGSQGMPIMHTELHMCGLVYIWNTYCWQVVEELLLQKRNCHFSNKNQPVSIFFHKALVPL